MNKVKQGLSLILAAAILISSTGIGLGTEKLNAEVPAAKSLSKSTPSFAITFYVPEVIYLTPSLGTTSSFQYFVDCDTSGNLNNSRNKTTGTVYFNCASASATNVSISVSGGSISSWSITTQNTNTFNGTINSGSVTTAQAQGVESYLTWTATYYINGEAKTATAYTCVYAPYCKPVGAAARFNNSYGADNYAQAVSWISGVYGYSTATRGGNYDPRTASNSLYSLGASVTPPVAGNHTPVSSWLTAVSGGSIGYQSKDASDDGTLYSNSPHGLLTVDTSRYSNMNQIPNFTAGFMVTDDESNESCTSYWVDFTDRSHNDNGFDGDNNNVWTERDDRPSTNIDGTAAPSTQRQENIRYNGTWSRAISSTGNQELRFKGLLLAEQNGDEAQVSTCTYLTLTKTDKSALRSAVRQYTNYGLQTADYTSGSWSTFSAELVNAYQRLVNPKYSADVSTTNLVNAYNALSRNTYSANIYHRSADGYVYQDESLTFYSSETVYFGPNSYTGYTLSSASGSTTSTSAQTWYNQRANITVTYTYTPNTNTVYKVNHYKVNVAENNWDFAEQDTLSGTTNTSVTAPHKSYPGFYASSEGGSYDTGIIAPDGSLVITQYYRRYFYNITFNANGGTGGAGTTSMIYGGTLTAPSPGTRTGYTFANWSPAVPATVGIGDATYTAQWTPITYTIAYNGNGATGGTTASSSHTYDTAKSLTTNGFTRTGYTFAGWATSAGGAVVYSNGQSVTNLTAAQGATVTLYAVWAINHHFVNIAPYHGQWVANDGTTVDDSFMGVGAYGYQGAYGGTITLTNLPTRTGYTFNGFGIYNTYSVGDGPGGGTGQGSWNAGTKTFTYGPNDGDTCWLVASWAINTYTIYFDEQGGSTVSDITQNYGTSVTPPANPTKTGYTFTGWSPAVPSTMPANNTTCVAQWSINPYTITFNGNGGSTPSPITQDYGTTVTVPANPTRTGYTFSGWLPACPTTMPASNTNCVAQWTANTYTVAYNANTGTGTTASTTHTYDVSKALATNSFSKTGYTFYRWNTASDGSGTSYTSGQSVTNLSTVNGATVTLYAIWTANTYSVAFNGNGNTGSSMSNQSFTYDVTQALTTNTFTRTGYTFSGWNTAANGSGTSYTDGQSVSNLVPSGTITLYAQWSINTYYVVYNANSGSGSMSNQGITYNTSAALTANAFSRTGYTFTGWNTVANGSGTSYANQASYGPIGAANVTLYAQWSINTYYVVFNANSGSGSMSNQGITYNTSAALTANAFSRTGYTFTGWNTAANGSGTSYANQASYGPIGTANVTLYAQWSINTYYVVFDANGGSSSMSNQGITYNTSAALTANAFSRTGYTFTGWNTAANGSGTSYANQASYGPIGAANVTLYAQWSINTYYVVFDANSGSGSMSNQGITYNTSAALTANAFSRTGYTFTGWNTAANGSGTSYANQGSYGPIGAANVTLYAQWTANTYTVIYNGNTSTAGNTANSLHTYNISSNLNSNGYTKIGNTFLGWSTSSSSTTADFTDAQSVINLTSSQNGIVTFYAVWSVNHYNITFNANGGSGGTGPVSMLYGAELTAPDVARTGYTLTNWSPSVPSTVPANDQIYSAQWNANTYTIVYNGNGNTGGSTGQSSHIYDSPEALNENGFTKTGYSFAGWNTVAGGTGNSYTDGQNVLNLVTGGTVTLYAQWSIDQHTITFNINDATGTTPTAVTQNYGTGVTLPTQSGFYYTNRTFYGWNTTTDATTWLSSYTVPAYSQTLYAVWGADYTAVIAAADLADNTTLPANNTNDPGYLPGGDWYEAAGFTNNGYYTRDMFTTASITALENAVSAVNYSKMKNEQGTVTAYATAITAAYNNLELAVCDYAPLQAKVNYTNSLTGTNYTVSTWNAVVDAVAVANDYISAQYKKPLQSYVNETYDSLVAAINALAWRPADYSGVNTAWNSRPSNLSIYTAASVAALNNYYNTIVWNLTLENNGQTTVNNYAAQIYSLINALQLRPADFTNVDNAIKAIPDNDGNDINVNANYLRTIYTDTSVTNLVNAVNTANNPTNRAKKIDEQTTVDGYATAILNMTAALDPLGADYTYLNLALELVPQWPSSYYTDATYTAYNNAKIAGNAVDRHLTITEQQTINDAVNLINTTYGSLSLKTVTYTVKYRDVNGNIILTDVTHNATAADLITEYAAEIEGYSVVPDNIEKRLTGTESENIFLFTYTIIQADFSDLDTVMNTEYSSMLISSIPVVAGDGTDKGIVYAYGNEAQRQAVSDAYDDAASLQAMAPLPDTAANRADISAKAAALSSAINTLLANPNNAVYTYVNNEITEAGKINLNRYTKASLDELQGAVDAVVTGMKATNQLTVNNYAAAIYNERAGTDALVAYQDTKAPKLDVYETTDTMLGSGLNVPGFNPEDYGDISYVYPGKAYYTYYCYTNSETPAILVNIADLADSNGRMSYPANMDVSKVSGVVNSGWMNYAYDSGVRAGTVTEGSLILNDTGYNDYTIGMNYDALGSDYYKQAGYLVLKPQFVQAGGKQFARYTISGADDSSATGNIADMTSLAGGTAAYQNGVSITTSNTTWTPENTITIYVEYRNSMSLESGTWYDDGRTGGTLNAYNNPLTDDQWVSNDYLYRVSGGATNDEMIGLDDTVYPSNDPNYGKDGLACFYYFLNDETDAGVITDFGTNGQYSATRMLMNNISSNPSAFTSGIHNWPKGATSISGFDPDTVNRFVYVHLADRWGNVFNKIIKTNNVDPETPSLANITNGSANLNESGGSGVSLLKLYQYAYEGSPQYVVPCCSDRLLVTNIINEPENILDISVGYATVTDGVQNRFTLYAKDKAGNEVTKTVYTNAAGSLSITVNDPENMGGTGAQRTGAKPMSDRNIYTFLLNDTITVNLNSPDAWPETYTITFDSDGGSSVAAISGIAGGSVTAPDDPVRAGYTFAGWNPSLPETFPDYDLTVTAQWTMQEPELAPAEGSTTVINESNHYIYGLAEGITQEDFESLYIEVSGNGRVEITPTAHGFGTGTKVELINNATDEVKATYYIIIFGDVNGDGIASAIDADIIYDYENWLVEWDSETQPYLFEASDLNGDDISSALDADIVYDSENWLVYIDQTTGFAYAY